MGLNEILAQLRAGEQKAYYDARYDTMPPLPGAAIFPSEKIVGDAFNYSKSKAGAARLLKLGAYDANVPLRGRQSFSEVKGDMPLFREGINLTEKDMADLVKINAYASEQLKTQIARIFNDRANLIKSAHVSVEKMRMDALSAFEINFSSNGVQYKLDYGAAATQKGAAGTAWSDAGADIIGDIQRVMKLLGLGTCAIYCSQTTFNYVLKNTGLKNAIFASMSAYGVVTEKIAKQFMVETLGANFVVFDNYRNRYTDVDGTTTGQLYPDDVVTFAPLTTLGNTLWGTTPEENASLLGLDRQGIETAVVDGGIAITTNFHVDTVRFETIVSAVAVPTLTELDYMYVLDINGCDITGAAITGTPTSGTASACTATYNGTPSTTPTLAYKWKIGNTASGTFTDIANATSATYTPDASDVDKFLKVEITASGSAVGTALSPAKKVVSA